MAKRKSKKVTFWLPKSIVDAIRATAKLSGCTEDDVVNVLLALKIVTEKKND